MAYLVVGEHHEERVVLVTQRTQLAEERSNRVVHPQRVRRVVLLPAAAAARAREHRGARRHPNGRGRQQPALAQPRLGAHARVRPRRVRERRAQVQEVGGGVAGADVAVRRLEELETRGSLPGVRTVVGAGPCGLIGRSRSFRAVGGSEVAHRGSVKARRPPNPCCEPRRRAGGDRRHCPRTARPSN